MIYTPRLTVIPLTPAQVRLHVAGGTLLEDDLGARPGHREVAEPLLSILRAFVLPLLDDPDRPLLYNTVWVALDRELNQLVADIKFKGAPDDEQTVELGYGTYPAFQRQGYMTELVAGMTNWALNQPGVERVTAETELTNTASQSVLLTNGFTPFDQDEHGRWWEKRRGGAVTDR